MDEQSTTRCLIASAVPVATLGVLLEQNTWSWLYAERPAGTVLMWLAEAHSGDIPWSDWRHGRAFNAESELAWWQQVDGLVSYRLLTTTDALVGIPWEEGGSLVSIERSQALLHGQFDEGSNDPFTWSEARIPRHLAYPVLEDHPAGKRVVLTIQRYRYARSGEVIQRLVQVDTVAL